MRPLLVVVIASLIFGSVQLFVSSETPLSSPTTPQTPVPSTERFDVELAFTCDLGPDAFSLDQDVSSQSLLVQLDGKTIFERTDIVPLHTSPIVIEDVKGLALGSNEFFIQANPSDSTSTAAVRIRVFANENVLAEDSIWSDFGGPIQGTLPVEVQP